jgi:quercetin dioxygenase-like cupin family protein
VSSEPAAQDPTRVYDSADQPWLDLPAAKGASMKVVVADEELHRVVFKFRFAPGTVLVPHTHLCHAVAHTVSGSWEYEGLKLPQGAVAYEPYGSKHQAFSDEGAELFVVLTSEDHQFLVNHMPDGSDFPMDMGFFKMLKDMTQDQLDQLAAALGLTNGA